MDKVKILLSRDKLMELMVLFSNFQKLLFFSFLSLYLYPAMASLFFLRVYLCRCYHISYMC